MHGCGAARGRNSGGGCHSRRWGRRPGCWLRQILRLCGKAGHGCWRQSGLRRNHACGPLARCVWAGAGRRGQRGRRGRGGITICHGHQSPGRLRISTIKGHGDRGKRGPPDATHTQRGGHWHRWPCTARRGARHLHAGHFNHWRPPPPPGAKLRQAVGFQAQPHLVRLPQARGAAAAQTQPNLV